MPRSVRNAALAATLALPAAIESPAAPAPVVPRVVEVVATDFHFTAPSRLEAGWVTFRLVNEGKAPHHIQISRLKDGRRTADLVALVARKERYPAWAVDAGGPATIGAGLSANATVYLEPGRYALTCWIDIPDGVPHMMKGMSHELVVHAPEQGPNASGGAATDTLAHDVSVQLTEYAYTLSGPVQAGRRTLRIDNTGAAQPHEMQLVALQPGKTLNDVLAWLAKRESPGPGKVIGGVSAIAPGAVAYVSADFAPGRYVLLCFVPDDKDRKPHIAKGMMKEFEVR